MHFWIEICIRFVMRLLIPDLDPTCIQPIYNTIFSLPSSKSVVFLPTVAPRYFEAIFVNTSLQLGLAKCVLTCGITSINDNLTTGGSLNH